VNEEAMKTRWIIALLLLPALTASLPSADEKKAEKDDGFVPMWNGKDLTGWVNVNCAPGTFFVKDDMIVTTGKPTGYLRTEKQYENFIADFEWMHVPPSPEAVGNSGFFVWADPIPAVGTGYTRGIEVQVLVNLEKENAYTSHGDLFSIWGATCKPDRPHPMGWQRCLPSERRAKGANEWNHYIVTAKDGAIKLNVNGKEVSGVSECKPRKGYLALESEGSECRFRNLKIKELPSSNPKPDECADVAQGHVNLFTGLNLDGWKTDGSKDHWKTQDGVLRYDGKGKALMTEKAFGDAEFIADFRFQGKGSPAPCEFVLRRGKDQGVRLSVTRTGELAAVVDRGAESNRRSGMTKDLKPAGQWNRLQATLKGRTLEVTINGKPALEADISAGGARGTFGFQGEGEMDYRSLFVRELK
jgi:hypothetical protein